MSWPLVEVGDVARVAGGYAFKSKEFITGGYPIVRISNITGSKVELETAATVPESAVQGKERFLVESGDILIAMSGATTGKIGIVPEGIDKVYLNQRVGRFLNNKDKLDSNYLHYFLLSSECQIQINNLAAGAAQPNISGSQLESIKIPLPPLPVQKQIAAVLEKADNLRNQCQQMEQELNTLAQSVFLDMFGDPINNPKGFDLVSLGSLSHVQIGPFGTMLHKSDYISGGVPLINPTHIVKSLIVPSEELTITKEKYQALPQYHLLEGDIIMGRRGEMGRCAIIKGESIGYFCGTGSLFVRPDKEKLRARYLNDLLSSFPVKRWFEEQSLGATMPNLNKGIVNSLPVPLPSLELQIQYEDILENISDRLENYNDLKLAVSNNYNSLMQRAFKGELDLKDVA